MKKKLLRKKTFSLRHIQILRMIAPVFIDRLCVLVYFRYFVLFPLFLCVAITSIRIRKYFCNCQRFVVISFFLFSFSFGCRFLLSVIAWFVCCCCYFVVGFFRWVHLIHLCLPVSLHCFGSIIIYFFLCCHVFASCVALTVVAHLFCAILFCIIKHWVS